MSLNQIWDNNRPRYARLSIKSLKIDGEPVLPNPTQQEIRITNNNADFPYSESVSTALYLSNNNSEKYSFNETEYPPKKSVYPHGLYDYNGTTYTVTDEATFITALNNCTNGDIIYFNSSVTFTNSSVYHINKSILITGASVEIINNTSTTGIFDVNVKGVTIYNLKLKSSSLISTDGLIKLNAGSDHIVFFTVTFETNNFSVLCVAGSKVYFDSCVFTQSNNAGITHIKFDTGCNIEKLVVRNTQFTGNNIAAPSNSIGILFTNNAILNGDVFLDNNVVGSLQVGKNMRNFVTFLGASRQSLDLYVNNNQGYISAAFITIEGLGKFMSDVYNCQITNNNINNNDPNFLGLIVASSTTPNTLFPSDRQQSTTFRFRGYGNTTPSTIDGNIVEPLRPYTISNSLLTAVKADFVDIPSSVEFYLRPPVL